MPTSDHIDQFDTRAERRAAEGDARVKRPFYGRVWFWVTTIVVLLIVAAAVWAALLMPRVMAARDVLTEAVPLASQAKEQLLGGDSDGAGETVARLAELSAEAREQSDSIVWRGLEWVPVAGPNLAAVRVASESVDALVTEVVSPLATIELSTLKQPGGINLAALEDAAGLVVPAFEATGRIAGDMRAVNRDGLIGQVDDGVTQLIDAAEELEGILEPASSALQVMPGVLGADGPRSYLLLFQNNAESRGTGGNPAAVMRITFTDGRISIEEQASSSDFRNGRPDPIVEIDDASVALFDTKLARYVQDITLTPDFTDTSRIAQAYWAETFGTPVDGVISFDPVALSYLLAATGPIDLPTGQSLTADNAAPLLLNEVYGLFPVPAEQDDFFAGVAGLVFEALVSGDADMQALLPPLARSLDEGRLIFAPNDPAVAELIADTRLAGMLPADNSEQTALAVLINDVTEGKMNYYMQVDIDASSTQCTAPESPEFAMTSTITNTLQPDQVAELPSYISPARFFDKGAIATDLVLYGPVGASFDSVTVDGSATPVAVETEHLGRPAVRLSILNQPGETRVVTARFTGGEAEFGPLEVRHTPLVQPSTVTAAAESC